MVYVDNSTHFPKIPKTISKEYLWRVTGQESIISEVRRHKSKEILIMTSPEIRSTAIPRKAEGEIEIKYVETKSRCQSRGRRLYLE